MTSGEFDGMQTELVIDMKKHHSAVGRNGGRYIIKMKSQRDRDSPAPTVNYQIASFDPFLGEPRDAISTGSMYGDGISGPAVMLMK